MELHTIALDNLQARKTPECFQGPLWRGCAHGYMSWLSPMQHATDPCDVTLCFLPGNSRFQEMFSKLLGLPPDTPSEILGEVFLNRDHVVTLTQVEEIVRNAEWGMTDYAFAVKSDEPDEPVAIGRVAYWDKKWFAFLDKLSYKTLWICDHYHILLNNWSPPK